PPALDGNVLDDQAWATVEPVSGFRQSSPDEGQPATERTEVRVLFTDDAIYFGVVCYDQDPSAIIMSDSRRDSSMNDADSFQMVLDTFSDRQNGFVFGTTPAGQEYGGQVTNEGGVRSLFGGGGFSRGSGGGFNLNWDGAWQVRTEISAIGWSAEFAIPFRTIRYPDREVQV
ncbi:MAG: carbohydrate binding family 9 domain-containing protein, partial [Acidobacteriota bacterium]|nr:carbohydrate binding family 9 domain-containing protein [Acidobacteriota bacterium]